MPVPNDEIDFLRAERRAMADRRGKRKRGAANAAGIQVVSVGDPRRVPIADLEMRFNSTPTPEKKKLDGQNFFEAPVKPRRG